MSFIPKPQEIYKHFKGNLYQIVTIAEHSETGEKLVIYQALYGDYKVYARELSMFTGLVDKQKYPEAVQKYRFELQGPDSDRRLRESGFESREGEKPEEQHKTAAGLEKAAAEPVKTAAGPEKAVTEPVKTASDPERPSAVPDAEMDLDPMLVEFLDADTYEQKLNILAGLHHRITQDMITTMAVASDVEVEDGELEDRYRQLKTCLLTLEKYECNRVR